MKSRKNQNTSRKIYEKKLLRIEDLEAKQLLSAVGISTVDDAVAQFAAADFAVCDSVVLEEAPTALAGEEAESNMDEKLEFSIVGKKATLDFSNLEASENYTIKFTSLTYKTGKEAISYKSFKSNSSGCKTFKTTLPGDAVSMEVFQGTVKEIKAAGEEAEAVLETSFSGYSETPKLSFAKTDQTADSVTFQISNAEDGFLEKSVFSCKLNGAKKATDYIVEGGYLMEIGAEEATEFTVDANENVITISGLQTSCKHSISVRYSETLEAEEEDAISGTTTTKASNVIKVSTTREQTAAPQSVLAELDEAGNVTVKWQGEEGTVYTVISETVNAKGKVITKTVTTKATVNADGEGKYTVSKLASGTKYTFGVYANKTKEYDASAAVKSDAIITATTIPAPALKKIDATDTSIRFQITNWDKIEAALQEVEESEGDEATGGTIVVMSGEETLATFVYTETTEEDEGVPTVKGEWVNTMEESTCTMNCVEGKKKNSAFITITGLDANTNYTFQVTAFSEVVNENINTVAQATSKVAKAKTEIAAHPAVENLEVSDITANSMKISWDASAEKASYVVTLTCDTGKTITKTVKNTEVTISGLKSNTEYTISVVTKADKYGSASEATTTTATTLGEFKVQSTKSLGNGKFMVDFGMDMTECSGYLDFTVKGSGSTVVGGKRYSDSVAPTDYRLYYGDDAPVMATAYQMENPDANVLVVNADNSVSALQAGDDDEPIVFDTTDTTLLTKKHKVSAVLTTSLGRGEQYSTLNFDVNYTYTGKATATLKGGVAVNDQTGVSFSLSAGVNFTW